MEKNLQKKAIESIQHSHLIGLSLVNFIIFAFYYFIYTGPGIKGHMPLYMKIYLIGSLLLWLLLYLQEREYIFKNYNRKNYKFRVAIYMTINLLSGYNIPFLISSAYAFYFADSRDDAFTYWLLICGIITVSAIGLFFFCLGEFQMFGIQKGSFIRIIGILIVLLSFGLLLYVSLIVPVDSEENRTIWMGMIMLFCSHMLIVRTYFYLGLLDYDIREDGVKLQ
ncbi:DUF5079 domain-containing protein [Staphylococcus haemolyticus]|uniref:DUF5079 family protein n=1 Tax=Staphylococcus haemolyticus TaxID=1283 RepID=UPI000D1FD3AE|nr:DUF5079 family protein [Staphylococcus haemolyticus]PTK60802.1 DUF5079 domain-containing protein [Staphylococcus haemolyticus]PTK86558.1 DUF5079 domain-containing protein [Staphylococcus haemolyticus]RIO64440.1 DUF5079 family protein [Staphylococcus haemolyticus]